MVEKVLIVNFDFPPNEGIGGRRWAKLAKGLAAKGVEVHVVKADALQAKSNSPWQYDVQHHLITTISLPRTYPKVLQKLPSTIFEKLSYKWQTFWLYQSCKGTIYDISLGWEREVIPAVDRLCKVNSIETILATGAPWNMLYELAKYKEINSTIKLLVDFRDPWIEARNYGMVGLSKERLEFEMHKQSFVLEKANWVTSPYLHLTQTLKSYAPASKAHFAVLPHFFDAADFEGLTINAPADEIRLVYGGEMYVECENQLIWLCRMLDLLRLHDIDVYSKLHIDFYTPTTKAAYFTNHQGVEFHTPIGKEIVNIYAKASALILLLTESKKDDLTTKYFEYLPMRKTLIGIGVTGEVSRFLHANGLGLNWSPETTFNQFYGDLKKLKDGDYMVDENRDLKLFELKSAVENLLELIQ